MTILEVIQQETLNKLGKNVNFNTPLKEIGIDSLALLDFVVDLEKKFNVRLNDEDLVKLQTIGDVVNAIESLKK